MSTSKQTKPLLDTSILEGTYKLPPDQDQDRDPSKPKYSRRSISVSGKTYDRLCMVTSGSVASFVEDIVMSALEDPVISARVLAACCQEA